MALTVPNKEGTVYFTRFFEYSSKLQVRPLSSLASILVWISTIKNMPQSARALPSDVVYISFLSGNFRVSYAIASTLEFVSGMSYMTALMLVNEPIEGMAYASLVSLLEV